MTANGAATAVTAASDHLPSLPPAKLGELIPYGRFSPSELAEVDTLAKGIDFTDAASVMVQMNAPNQQFADAITRELGKVAVYETRRGWLRS